LEKGKVDKLSNYAKIMVKKYYFAALDFIFDKKEEPYFLEANSFPGGIYEGSPVFKNKGPFKYIVEFMKKYSSDPCVITTKRKDKFFVYDELKKEIPNLRLCFREYNRKNRTFLVDINNEKFKPSCIYRNGNLISTSFERKIPVINPRSIVHITKNKVKTYSLVKNLVNIPEYFIIKNNKQFKGKQKEFGNNYVAKSLTGSYGEETHISEHKGLKYPYILQKRIFPKKIKNKFWDVRVFLVNGKFTNGVIRLSDNPITNFGLGAKPYKLPKRLENKIIKPAEKIVRAIDKEASRNR